jgi:signal recognition particle GTPase
MPSRRSCVWKPSDPGLPFKFVGLGEQPDDLQPFDAKQFAQALFEE